MDFMTNKYEEFKLLDPTEERYGQLGGELAAMIPSEYHFNAAKTIAENVKIIFNERNRPLYQQIKHYGQELGAVPVLAGELTFENCAPGLNQLLTQLETGWGPALERLSVLLLEARVDLTTRKVDGKAQKAVIDLIQLVDKAGTEGEELILKAKKLRKTVLVHETPTEKDLASINTAYASLNTLMREQIAPVAIGLAETIAESAEFRKQIDQAMAKMAKN